MKNYLHILLVVCFYFGANVVFAEGKNEVQTPNSDQSQEYLIETVLNALEEEKRCVLEKKIYIQELSNLLKELGILTGSKNAESKNEMTISGLNFVIARTDEPDLYDWWIANGVDKTNNKKVFPDICEKNHGKGWRLPTQEELALIYKNRKSIHGLTTKLNEMPWYWSSTSNKFGAYHQNFDIGSQRWCLNLIKNRIRCIKSI